MEIIDADGPAEYDADGRLVAITNAAGLVWRYSYDEAGRLATETDFDGRTQRYGYDTGNRTISTGRRWSVTNTTTPAS
ncbi:RHS repeat domain-containing protein [Actinoplanes sp. NPDC089786]|uniref:RHS repeat domain-containing protein n=1 Tax=Actinoplanes sp. NPDC089786 TaxID=3155185 RepID=UPI003447329D